MNGAVPHGRAMKKVLRCGTGKAVQGILGHASASTTLDYYVRMDLKQMQNAAEQFALAFGL